MKKKVSIAVDSKLADRVERHWRKSVSDAANFGKDIPRLSNVYESLVQYALDHIENKPSAKEKRE